MALADDENPDRLLEAEDDIEKFLHHYPQDERAKEIEGYRDDIELMKMERRFDRRVKSLKVDQSNAVVRAYAEAMQVAPFDPEQAAAKLEALLALYDQTDAQGAAERLPADTRTLAVQLAGKKLPDLRKAAREQFREDLTFLKRQLANADKLHLTQPARRGPCGRGSSCCTRRSPGRKKSWTRPASGWPWRSLLSRRQYRPDRSRLRLSMHRHPR